MAGIGFVLRKLLNKKNVTTFATTHLHASFIACGPWLLTALFFLGPFEYQKLMLINFSVATVLTAPLVIIMTRYLADHVYEENLKGGSGMLLGALSLFIVIVFPFVSCLLNVESAISIIVLSAIWIVSPYLSALKNYWGVTLSFFIGAIFTILLSAEFGITGYNIGLLIIFLSLITLILIEFSEEGSISFDFLSYFVKYYELALSGLIFSIAIWFDKWVMWHEGVHHYSADIFAAYLAGIPLMALFIVTEETKFYEAYQKYFGDILAHANLEKIQYNFKEIKKCLIEITKKMILLQLVICLPIFLIGSSVTFRIAIVSASLQVLTIFMTIILTYFDCRRQVLKVQLLFLVSNVLLTLTFINVPGVGYLLSALLTFAYTARITYTYTQKIPYHTFVSQVQN